MEEHLNKMRDVFRSYLYVPASEPALVEKAFRSRADAIVIDLEDAVPASAKIQARSNAASIIRDRPAKPTFVRVNGFASGLTEGDVAAVSGQGLTGLRLPKCEDPSEVEKAVNWLNERGCPGGVVVLIESALGVERAYDLASASPRVIGLALGEIDLAADLRARGSEGLAYARSRCVVAGRAAKVLAVIQAVHADIRDIAGLRATTEQGRRMGFLGRSAIHPAQVDIINEVFTPTPEELERAQRVLDALESESNRGVGAFVTDDGEFVDAAVGAVARTVLELGCYAAGRG